MSDHADHADPTTSLDHRLEALDTAIGDLRRALERLRRRLDGEVRTRRLVLVEDDGFEDSNRNRYHDN